MLLLTLLLAAADPDPVACRAEGDRVRCRVRADAASLSLIRARALEARDPARSAAVYERLIAVRWTPVYAPPIAPGQRAWVTSDEVPPSEAVQAEAAFRLAMLLRRGLGVPADRPRAEALLRSAAAKGHADARAALEERTE